MEKSKDHGEPSLSGYIYNTAPESVVQKISQKRGQKDLSNKNTRKFAVEQPVLGTAT